MSRVLLDTGRYYQQSFGPAVRHSLRGLGAAMPICLDQNENAIDCGSPDCTYGDCGATSTTVPTGGCLDQKENQVLCMDPNCTYGDCLPPSAPATGALKAAVTSFPSTVALPAGPAPRVAVPLSSSIPGSMSLFLGNSSLIGGFPNWAVLGGVLVAAVALTGVVGGRRRRR